MGWFSSCDTGKKSAAPSEDERMRAAAEAFCQLNRAKLNKPEEELHKLQGDTQWYYTLVGGSMVAFTALGRFVPPRFRSLRSIVTWGGPVCGYYFGRLVHAAQLDSLRLGVVAVIDANVAEIEARRREVGVNVLVFTQELEALRKLRLEMATTVLLVVAPRQHSQTAAVAVVSANNTNAAHPNEQAPSVDSRVDDILAALEHKKVVDNRTAAAFFQDSRAKLEKPLEALRKVEGSKAWYYAWVGGSVVVFTALGVAVPSRFRSLRFIAACGGLLTGYKFGHVLNIAHIATLRDYAIEVVDANIAETEARRLRLGLNNPDYGDELNKLRKLRQELEEKVPTVLPVVAPRQGVVVDGINNANAKHKNDQNNGLQIRIDEILAAVELKKAVEGVAT